MTVGPSPEPVTPVPAGALLMLIAERSAREIGEAEGSLPADAVDRWLETLNTQQRHELGRYDRLVSAIRAGLAARRSGA